jgi:hypothetical protein
MSAHDLTPRSAPMGPDGRCDAGHLDCPCTDAPTPAPAAGPRLNFVPWQRVHHADGYRVITSELLHRDHSGRCFESVVIGGPREDAEGDRYFTREHATRGHDRLVARMAVAS